ncbi:MAG: glycosyltransferase family 2 protein [Lachnospiraceae bacterium]
MRVQDDQEFNNQIEESKRLLTVDMGTYARFLAYTHNEGPDDVEPEAERTGIRKLKGTPVWTLLWPVRMCYRALRYLKEVGPGELAKKIKNAIIHNKYAKKRMDQAYLASILPGEKQCQQRQEDTLFHGIISVLVPLYNTPVHYLREMIQSVMVQTYPHWELVLADASGKEHAHVASIVQEYASKDSRIIYQKLEQNLGIAENTNACMRIAKGEYLSLFDHDDLLHPSALFEVAKVIGEKNADFIYTDEATFDGDQLDNILTYHFKPDYSVDNLRGVNYICHLSTFRKTLIDEVGMFLPEYDGSQDHDLILRLTDASKVVAHIPKLLYFWRSHDNSTSKNIGTKAYAIDAGRRAVRDAESRRGYPGTVYSTQICKTHYRTAYEHENPMISIILSATKGSEQELSLTAASIQKMSTYRNFELYISRSNEEYMEAVRELSGEYIVMLQAGIEIITPQWMEELLMYTQRSDVCVTGMQILNENHHIISSDLVIGTSEAQIALEVNAGERFDAPGYMGRNYYAHNVSAVSGGAIMLKTQQLKAYCGEGQYTEFESICGGCIDYCLAMQSEGQYHVVLNPYALCMVQTSKWQELLSLSDRKKLFCKYKERIENGDPYYNKNLSLVTFWQRKLEEV